MARLQHTIDPSTKKQAENILNALGIPPAVASRLFYTEIIKQKCLPFNITPIHTKDEKLNDNISLLSANKSLDFLENEPDLYE